jgi:hypothetical protein
MFEEHVRRMADLLNNICCIHYRVIEWLQRLGLISSCLHASSGPHPMGIESTCGLYS